MLNNIVLWTVSKWAVCHRHARLANWYTCFRLLSYHQKWSSSHICPALDCQLQFWSISFSLLFHFFLQFLSYRNWSKMMRNSLVHAQFRSSIWIQLKITLTILYLLPFSVSIELVQPLSLAKWKKARIESNAVVPNSNGNNVFNWISHTMAHQLAVLSSARTMEIKVSLLGSSSSCSECQRKRKICHFLWTVTRCAHETIQWHCIWKASKTRRRSNRWIDKTKTDWNYFSGINCSVNSQSKTMPRKMGDKREWRDESVLNLLLKRRKKWHYFFYLISHIMRFSTWASSDCLPFALFLC